MAGLKSTLERHLPPGPGDFGSDGPEAQGIAFDRDNLRSDLIELSKKNELYFRICVGMVVFLFVGAIVIIAAFLSDPDHIAALFGALGISVLGVVRLMIKLMTEKKSTDVAIAMLGNLESAVSATVLKIMLKNI